MLDELFKTRGPVAQLGQSDRKIVEAHNLLVPGSNPGGPTQIFDSKETNANMTIMSPMFRLKQIVWRKWRKH